MKKNLLKLLTLVLALVMVVTVFAGRAKHWAIRGRIGSSLGITGCSR